MPSGSLTFLDLAKLSGSEQVTSLVELITAYAPEFATIHGRTITGTSFKTPLRRQLPPTQSRNVNEGVSLGKSEYDMKTIECTFMDAHMQVDEALVDADHTLPSLLTNESIGQTKSAALYVGSQFYYGIANDPKGFPGLQAQVDPTMVVDAGGTTAATATSVYAIIEGDQDVSFLFGNNGSLVMSDEWLRQRVNDSNNKVFFAWLNNLKSWIGMQSMRPTSAGVIKNLTADVGHTMTDSLGEDLLAKFPIGATPSYFLMNRRSRRQLQQSRSAVNVQAYANGAVAPLPTEISGVPILCTDSLINTEALR